MRISGMKSGLDVEALVKQLIDVERKPMEVIKKRKADQEGRANAWNDLTKRLEALRDLTEKLKTGSTYSERKVKLSDETIASFTAGTEAATGSLDLEVRSLATPQRVETGIFSSLTTPLGLSGTVFVSGKAIEVVPEDTLESIQAKIIQQNINATCRAVKLRENQYRLVISSRGMGSSAVVSFADSGPAAYSCTVDEPAVAGAAITGNVAAGLHSLTVSALAQAQHIKSDTYASKDTALGLSGALSVNGALVNVAATDTLESIAGAINASNAGVTASVTADAGSFSLSLLSNTSGQAGSIGFTDQSGVLRGIGLLTALQAPKHVVTEATDAQYSINGSAHRSSTNQVSTIPGVTLNLTAAGSGIIRVGAAGGVLKALGIFDSSDRLAHETMVAQDATFSVDGYTFTRGTNNITDSVPGLTINLKKIGKATVEVAESSEETLKVIKDWVAKYNEIVGTLKEKLKYDLKAKTPGPLTGDSLARDLMGKLQLKAIYTVPGLTGIDSLDDIGLTIGKHGSSDADKLVIDDKKLKEELESNRLGIMRLFGAPTLDSPNPADGIAKAMWVVIDSHIHSQTGLVHRHVDSLNLTADSIQRQLDDWEIRLSRREHELYAKYSRMEVALTRIQNQAGTINRLI